MPQIEPILWCVVYFVVQLWIVLLIALFHNLLFLGSLTDVAVSTVNFKKNCFYYWS